MKKVSGTLVILFLIALVVVAWVATHVEHPVAGATFVGLPLKCRLEVYDARLALDTTVTVTCPGQALIRVWPLPKGAIFCQDCVDNFWKQLDWGEVLPDINLP